MFANMNKNKNLAAPAPKTEKTYPALGNKFLKQKIKIKFPSHINGKK